MNLHNWSGKHWSRGSRWYYGKGPGTDAIDGKSMDIDYVRIWQREE